MDLQPLATGQPDGAARYRVDGIGTRVLILPATCKLDSRHSLAATGYRAVAVEGQLHVICLACAAASAADDHWRLATSGPSPDRAELDDEPYRDLAQTPVSR